MKIMVIFDSFYGNTEKIAESIGKALQPGHTVSVVRTCKATSRDVEMAEGLIVGSPTRAFRPSEATVEFLKFLPNYCLEGKKAAAFDTRISTDDISPKFLQFMINLGGYAAKPIAKLLAKKGASTPLAAEGFFVNGKEGPLKDGELERAGAWAKSLFD